LADTVVSRALLEWIYFSPQGVPTRDDARVLAAFEPSVASSLIHELHELRADFYRTDAHRRELGLWRIADMAKSEFLARHPTISEDAASRLASCYAFDIK